MHSSHTKVEGALNMRGPVLLYRWGICERHGPKQYDFAAYMELFKKARKHGLKVQAVMSFHAGGGNVGDGSCDIPLPDWVIKVCLIWHHSLLNAPAAQQNLLRGPLRHSYSSTHYFSTPKMWWPLAGILPLYSSHSKDLMLQGGFHIHARGAKSGFRERCEVH